VVSHNDGTIFAFSSVYNNDSNKEMNDHLINHGDGVKDIALTVENATATYDHAIKNGGVSVLPPTEFKDSDGSVVMSTVKTYGDTVHTFVERHNYKGLFLPGFKPHHLKEALNAFAPPVHIQKVDHVVGNQPDKEMEPVVNHYEKMLGFHRFWTVDDKMIHTEYSSLRSVVVTDYDENIKMPINEPAAGKRKSQIQEFVDYYHGSGAQHIALRTEEIIPAVENLSKRGVEFLTIPTSYYDNLRKNLPDMNIKISEDIDVL
jgi:4-hydroxyphenylpyruvate dioxygenase